MELLPNTPSLKGEAEYFTGEVWRNLIHSGDEQSRATVNIVRYAPGARSAWHSHPNGQTLLVVDGRGQTQARGGEILEIRPGDSVYTPPGEWHWHGAHPDHVLAHYSVTEALGPDQEGPEVIWGAHVGA